MATEAPVDFNEVVARSQAITLAGMGNMFTATADRQSAIFLKKADEIDPVQASAMRQIMFPMVPTKDT